MIAKYRVAHSAKQLELISLALEQYRINAPMCMDTLAEIEGIVKSIKLVQFKIASDITSPAYIATDAETKAMKKVAQLNDSLGIPSTAINSDNVRLSAHSVEELIEYNSNPIALTELMAEGNKELAYEIVLAIMGAGIELAPELNKLSNEAMMGL